MASIRDLGALWSCLCFCIRGQLIIICETICDWMRFLLPEQHNAWQDVWQLICGRAPIFTCRYTDLCCMTHCFFVLVLCPQLDASSTKSLLSRLSHMFYVLCHFPCPSTEQHSISVFQFNCSHTLLFFWGHSLTTTRAKSQYTPRPHHWGPTPPICSFTWRARVKWSFLSRFPHLPS